MFAKFMNKKDFHPGSKANIRRVWIAEQKKETEETKQRELKEQYLREQDRFLNRQLVSNDEKLKLGLNFMYDVPPGYNKDKDKEDKKEEEVKFEWQKGAPREAYAKNLEARDQPFGIPVRNVKCIRCGKWGHVNTDRECPLFNKASTSEVNPGAIADVADPLKLMQDMRSDGLALKQSVMGRVFNPNDPNQQLVASDDEQEDPEAAFLASLTEKQKRKLLRKLDKLEKKEEEEAREAKKQKKKKKSKRRDRCDSSSSEDQPPRDRNSRQRKRRSKHSDSEDERHRKRITAENITRKIEYKNDKPDSFGSHWEDKGKSRRKIRKKMDRDRSLSSSSSGDGDSRQKKDSRESYKKRDYKDGTSRKTERSWSFSHSDSVEEGKNRKRHRNSRRS